MTSNRTVLSKHCTLNVHLVTFWFMAVFLIISWNHCLSFAGELSPKHPDYPEVFDFYGTLDSHGQDVLIINDMVLSVSPATSYHSPGGFIDSAEISEGDRIGILLSGTGSVLSVWLIAAGNKPDKQTDYANQSSKNEITYYKESGVWKN